MAHWHGSSGSILNSGAPCGPLVHHAIQRPSDSMLQECVCLDRTATGWNTTLLRQLLPPRIIAQITPYQIGPPDNTTDCPILKHTPNGVYSATAFETPRFGAQHWRGALLWKLHISPRIKTFLWILLHGKLLTNLYIVHCHLTNDSSCMRCRMWPGSLEHVFRQCPLALQLWPQSNVPINMQHTFHLPFLGWLDINLHNTSSTGSGTSWQCFFATTLWFIWKWHRASIFQNNFHRPPHVVDHILGYVHT